MILHSEPDRRGMQYLRVFNAAWNRDHKPKRVDRRKRRRLDTKDWIRTSKKPKPKK